jgi:hypothetical protein
MKYFIKILQIIAMILFANTAIAEQKIQLSRVISQLQDIDNTMIIEIKDNGEVHLKYPSLHVLHGKNIKYVKSNNMEYYESLLNKIDTSLTSRMVKNFIKSNKANENLFYSSDPNPIQIKLLNNNKIQWELSIPNLLELKHYIDLNPRLTETVSLIESLDKLSEDYLLKHFKENNK